MNLNNIAGNAVAGLHVETGAYTGTLNAENNWWGAASGPGAPDGPGTGDSLIDPDGVVDFTPFLTAAQGLPCPTPPTPPFVVQELGIASLFFSVTQPNHQDRLIDIKVEILKNNNVIGGGETLGADIAGLDAAHSTVVAVPLTLNPASATFPPGSKLKIRVKIRRSNHANFPVKLWYGAPADANGSSRFTVEDSGTDTFYLKGAACPSTPCNRPLGTTPGTAAKAARLTATGLYKTFGTWTYTFP